MLRFAAVCLAASALLAAPVSAQVRPRVVDRPAVNVAERPAAVLPGQSILDGAWAVGVGVLGTLTMSVGANGVLNGSFLIGSFEPAVPCSGHHNGAQFILMCSGEGLSFALVGAVEADEPVATQRSRFPGNRLRLRGSQYIGQFGASGQVANLVEAPLVGDPTP